MKKVQLYKREGNYTQISNSAGSTLTVVLLYPAKKETINKMKTALLVPRSGCGYILPNKRQKPF